MQSEREKMRRRRILQGVRGASRPGGTLCGGAPVLALALAPVLAQAQGLDYGALEELFMEPVTTSVTGAPQRASEVPASMRILTADDIRRSGAVDLPGVLKQVTGIDVLQWSASHADVAVRGYNKAFSSRLLVLVNGRQIYADHYGYTPWAALPVELAEVRQIEVVRGPNSALFGFNAVGGVINIVTFDALHDDTGFVAGTVGAQEHLQLSAARTLALGERTGLRLSAGTRTSEDFDTPQRISGLGTRAGDERHALAFDLHHRLAPGVDLELEGSRVLAQQSSMSPAYSMAHERMVTRSLLGRLTADSRYGLSEATLYRNWIDNDVYAPVFDGLSYTLSAEPVVAFSNRLSVARLQHAFKPAAQHTVRAGIEYRDSQLPTAPLRDAQVSYQVASFNAMWEWQLLPELTATLAAREDRLALDRDGNIPAGLGLRNSDWQRMLEVTGYNLSLVWQAGDRDVLRFGAARGFQLPSLFNLGGSLYELPVPPEFQPPAVVFTTGSPLLDATKVDNIELGWERRWQQLPVRSVVTLFRGTNEGLIADAGGSDIAAAIFSSPANISDSDTQGVELTLDGTLGAAWRWRFGYLYQEIDDSIDALYPVSVSYVDYATTTPRHLVTANLQWSQGPWELDVFARCKSRFTGLHLDDSYVFDPLDPFKLPEVVVPLSDFAVLDLHLGYRINEQLRLDVSGQNLLHDEQVQTSGPAAERRLFATLRYDF